MPGLLTLRPFPLTEHQEQQLYLRLLVVLVLYCFQNPILRLTPVNLLILLFRLLLIELPLLGFPHYAFFFRLLMADSRRVSASEALIAAFKLSCLLPPTTKSST